MFYNDLYTLFKHNCLIFLLLLWGCSSEPGIIEEDDPDEVAVIFSVGEVMTRAGTAFNDSVPVKIFVYSRSAGATDPDYSQTPYKVVNGRTKGESSNLSSVVLTGGNISIPDNTLTLRRGRTYDFVVVVNNSPKAVIGQTLNADTLSGFRNGWDILSGRKENVVIAADHATNQSIPVTFSAGGADQDGNLPHLCSAVYTKIISNIAMNVICEIDSVCFKECLSDSADLPFSDDTIKNKIVLVVNRTDYTGSYSAPGDTITDSKNATINNTTVKDVKSDYGYLLPYPLRYPYKQYNVVNMNFHLKVNNTAVIFYAPGLQVPEFKAGYRYGFTIELDNGVIHLKLDVEPWSVLSWDSTMGGDPGDSFVQYTLGSWNTVSWQAGMGGGSGNTQAALTVGGWSGITWTSDMGK